MIKVRHEGSLEFATLESIQKTAPNITSLFFNTKDKYVEVIDYIFGGGNGCGVGLRFHEEIPFEGVIDNIVYSEYEFFIEKVDKVVIIPLKHHYQVLLIKDIWTTEDKTIIPFTIEGSLL